MENLEKNCEMLKTWTIIKAKAADGDSNLTSDGPSEESDGISVISDSEVYKTTASNNVSDSEEKTVTTEDVESDGDLDYLPLTPPTTPEIFTKSGTLKERADVKETETTKNILHTSNGNKTLIIGVVFSVVASILYLHISGLNSELRAINVKLTQLEHEHELLKIAFGKLNVKTLVNVVETHEDLDEQFFSKEKNPELQLESNTNQMLMAPTTKTVWLGNEKEEKVEILDKKQNSQLPNYCFFSDENDLFYEYNVEICEAKRRKLETKKSRKEKKTKVDDLNKLEKGQSYDSYIAETLKSLSDEIQEIKNLRSLEMPIIDVKNVNDTSDNPKDTLNYQEEKPNKRREKKKRLNRQKAVNSGEWVEKRMTGREEARKKNEKQEEVNWYLKRKNEREINRLETEF